MGKTVCKALMWYLESELSVMAPSLSHHLHGTSAHYSLASLLHAHSLPSLCSGEATRSVHQFLPCVYPLQAL